MKISDRLELVDKIGREIQSRYSFSEVDGYLGAFGINPLQDGPTNSKWLYVKTALRNVGLEVVLEIARDLDLATPHASIPLEPPANWKGTRNFRLFISHLSKDKLKATRLKDCLAPYAIAGFVAHEDIHPTLEWQAEIERGLATMDAMVAVHTPGFALSNWTQQEVGYALGRGVKVISFKMGEDPTGFISKRQALVRQGRSAEDIAREISRLLGQDTSTSARREAAVAAAVAAGDIF